MTLPRKFTSAEFMQPADGEPIRSVITESEQATVVAWHIKPGQKIACHIHPNGQDTWTILSGKGEYFVDLSNTKTIQAGDVLVARTNDVHGVLNTGTEPLVFISVVAPAEAGYQLLE